MSVLYMAMCLFVLAGIISLAVDFGRVQLAKTELQSTADAAARAAAVALPGGNTAAFAAAHSVAGLNKADGTFVTLLPTDVVCGMWNSTARRVEPGGWGDAVQVTTTRSAQRGNPVSLYFGRLIGIPTFDVSATAVAHIVDERVGIVGLDGIENKGGAVIDSYNPALGPYAQSQGAAALVGSNGDIVLSNNSKVLGDAHPGVGHSAIGGTVTGSRAPLATPLEFLPVSAGAFSTDNDNSKIPGNFLAGGNLKMGKQQSLTLPGGTYYVKNLDLNAGAVLTFTGPATFYVTGDVSLGGHVKTAQNRPQNFTVNMVGAGAANLSMSGGSALHVYFYGPQSPLTIGGGGDLYGALVGKTIAIGGNGAIHHDLSIRRARGGVTLVR